MSKLQLIKVINHGQDYAVYLNGEQITTADPSLSERTEDVVEVANNLAIALKVPLDIHHYDPEDCDWSWEHFDSSLMLSTHLLSDKKQEWQAWAIMTDSCHCVMFNAESKPMLFGSYTDALAYVDGEKANIVRVVINDMVTVFDGVDIIRTTTKDVFFNRHIQTVIMPVHKLTYIDGGDISINCLCNQCMGRDAWRNGLSEKEIVNEQPHLLDGYIGILEENS